VEVSQLRQPFSNCTFLCQTALPDTRICQNFYLSKSSIFVQLIDIITSIMQTIERLASR